MHNSLATSPILLLLVQVALILGLSRVVGVIFARLRQPQVMGEMIAGIMLGPSLLGLLFPHAYATIFPASSVANLNTLSQVGVIFFLFLIGLELDPKLIRNRGHSAVVISHASIVAPFLLGTTLTLFLYTRVFNNTPTMGFTSVALFMGAAMSITAFPVLARILTERNLHKTPVGAVAITCAAVDDVTAWCLLAFVVAIARAAGQAAGHSAIKPALITVGLALAYIAVMFVLVRPFLRRLERIYEQSGRLGQNTLAVIFLLTLASAYTTEIIGIHALFGAFLMGAVMPKGTAFVRTLSEKLEDYTVVFLLPIFFAYTGLRTQIGVLNSPALWGYTGLIILVACLGKFGGSAIAARATGLGWREASAIGILMNTRGLMELVILNIGRDMGVISTAVFAMMVLMAIVTTALTTPLLHWVYPRAELEADAAGEAEKARGRRRYTVLIPVALPATGAKLAALADVLSLQAKANRRIVALHLRRPVDREAYRAGLKEVEAPTIEAFQPLLATAKERDIPVQPIDFVSRDVPSDIARVARLRSADLILMGFHKPVFGQTILGGTVHRVMTGSDTDVAVFVDRGFLGSGKLLVPYLGGRHDRLALELAGRLARNLKGSTLTILHVVPPNRAQADSTLHAKSIVERTYNDPSQPTPVDFKIIEDPSPVDVVIEQAKQFDLVIIGVEEEWGLESHLFGWRPERIAQACPGSLLIVRKHAGIAMPLDESGDELHAGPVTEPVTPPKPVEAGVSRAPSSDPLSPAYSRGGG